MNAFWAYFWPIFTLSFALGAIAGLLGFRRRRRNSVFVAAAVLSLAGAALWHGPLGAADRFAAGVERSAKATLADWEMPQVRAHLHRNPLSRRLLLSGEADDFQRDRLVEIMSQIPGVGRATWDRSGGIPLIGEAAIVSALGFLLGLLLAYLVELRRRYNAQWEW